MNQETDDTFFEKTDGWAKRELFTRILNMKAATAAALERAAAKAKSVATATPAPAQPSSTGLPSPAKAAPAHPAEPKSAKVIPLYEAALAAGYYIARDRRGGGSLNDEFCDDPVTARWRQDQNQAPREPRSDDFLNPTDVAAVNRAFEAQQVRLAKEKK